MVGPIGEVVLRNDTGSLMQNTYPELTEEKTKKKQIHDDCSLPWPIYANIKVYLKSFYTVPSQLVY